MNIRIKGNLAVNLGIMGYCKNPKEKPKTHQIENS
jgi:hypothetical protein